MAKLHTSSAFIPPKKGETLFTQLKSKWQHIVIMTSIWVLKGSYTCKITWLWPKIADWSLLSDNMTPKTSRTAIKEVSSWDFIHYFCGCF